MTSVFQQSEGSNDLNGNQKRHPNEFEHIDNFTKYSVYVSWMILLLYGYIRLVTLPFSRRSVTFPGNIRTVEPSTKEIKLQ